MRNTNSGPTVIPADQLGDIVRSLNFNDATPAPHQIPHQNARITRQQAKQEAQRAQVLPPQPTRATRPKRPSRKLPKQNSKQQPQKRYPLRNQTESANVTTAVQRKVEPREKTSANSNPSQQAGTAIKVVLRIRPLTKTETDSKAGSCVNIPKENSSLLEMRPGDPKKHPVSVRNAGKAMFKFSKIYDENATQSNVFEGTALPVIENLFKGQNAVVFAYGVTSSGKTWTIQGSNDSPGILPRALDVIVNSIAKAKGYGLSQDTKCNQSVLNLLEGKAHDCERKTRARGLKKSNVEIVHDANYLEVSGEIDYKIYASYIEIYNERVYDLFKNSSSNGVKSEVGEEDNRYKNEGFLVDGEQLYSSASTKDTGKSGFLSNERPILKLKQDGHGGVYADGQTEVEISSTADIDQLLEFGQQNRKVAHTKANHHSSRSHAIFIITLKQCEQIKLANGRTKKLFTSSKLYIVDLAGSERTSRTENVGERLKEAAKINTSLMVLGRCINELRQNQRKLKGNAAAKTKIIPFRQSRLTRLLQQTFVHGSAVMIANVSPSMIDADETIHALRCAAIASEVTTAPSQKRAVLADCTNTIQNDENKCAKSSEMNTGNENSPKRARGARPPRAVEKPRQIGNSGSNALVNEQLKARIAILEEQREKDRKEIGLLRMEVDEASMTLQERELELEKKFRENERLRTRNIELHSHFRVIEYEVREEVMREADEIFKEIQERHDREIKEINEAHEDDRKRLMRRRSEQREQEREAQMRRVTRASLIPFEGVNGEDSDTFDGEESIEEESIEEEEPVAVSDVEEIIEDIEEIDEDSQSERIEDGETDDEEYEEDDEESVLASTELVISNESNISSASKTEPIEAELYF